MKRRLFVNGRSFQESLLHLVLKQEKNEGVFFYLSSLCVFLPLLVGFLVGKAVLLSACPVPLPRDFFVES